MSETTKKNDEPLREIPWPGGARSIELPVQQPEIESDPLNYFADSDLAEIDPNLTGFWPSDKTDLTDEPVPPEPSHDPSRAVTDHRDPAPQWPPPIDDPQMPPRAWQPDQFGAEATFVPETFIPEEPEETIRRSGLAYSAGIVFFVSVAFMLLLGWLADLLLGSAPFGLVAGIVVGSAIGFIQFFNISKRIYEPSSKKSDIHTIMSGPDDKENGSGL